MKQILIVPVKLFWHIIYVFFFALKAWVANFERPRMNANSLLASTTGLSPYLRFGCLSCRLFYFKLTDLYKKVQLLSTALENIKKKKKYKSIQNKINRGAAYSGQLGVGF